MVPGSAAYIFVRICANFFFDQQPEPSRQFAFRSCM